VRKRERRDLEAYARRVADEMGLRDWEIAVGEQPCENGNAAAVACTYGRKHALIEVGRDFRDDTAEEQRHYIVHELVHCHLEAADNMVEQDLEFALGAHADRVFSDGFKRQLEYGIDALATALAPHLPLPVWLS
jgi:hypothetical protein